MRLPHRIAAATATLALALGGVALAAPTAQATQADCYSYLSGLGYGGINSSANCLLGASGLPLAYQTCQATLNLQGVPGAITDEACRRAGTP
ncbi:hypothetical protein [Embleya sp. MST-111070]|uniref:hypothetical protein n=1 Tax=Embleya sp. MST-111070 TaxID=3398231 RepID=UPI003F734E8E